MQEVLSHLITFFIGALSGFAGKYLADRLIERHKSKNIKNLRVKEYHKIKSQLSKLIDEMKTDIRNPEYQLCREFFIAEKRSIPFNLRKPAFLYYENEHGNLMSQIRILESARFIRDITDGLTAPHFFIEDELYELLKNDNE